MIRQGEAAECALASLGMIISMHGGRTQLSELRRRFPLSLTHKSVN
ncbi:hypothetical protein EYR01_17235 [Xanthomonas oryzae pv. oryzae]|nr:hypothetical protein EYR01_17235 [Xanthomonas oryzae pv. oryzae]